MKTIDNNSRRKFIGALALGATASTISVLTNPIYANMTTFDDDNMNDLEDWFKKGIKGKHRIVYDGSTPHGGFPIIWNWAFYLTNNQTGSKDEDITAMTVLRHSATCFALNDEIWAKYKLGEMYGIKDNATGKSTLRNPFYQPKDGDFPMPAIEGIKRLQERGAMFCACDLAAKVNSNAIAQKMNLDPAKVYQEWKDAIHPGIQWVPSGVWALGRAQEHGCGYIFAGE